MRTAEARAVLPRDVSRAVALHQAAHVAAMVAALALDDYELLARSVDDRIAEPARAGLLPGLRRSQGGGARRGRAGQLDLGQRTHGVRAGAGARECRAQWRGPWPTAYRAGGAELQRARGPGRPRWRDGRPARSRPDEVPDRATGELAGLRRLRQRADRDRSRTRAAPRCGGLLEIAHRPPDLTAPSCCCASPSAAAGLRARRPRASGDSARSSFPSAEAGRLPPRGQHAAAPPRGAGPRGAASKGCCSSTRVTTRPARSRTGA